MSCLKIYNAKLYFSYVDSNNYNYINKERSIYAAIIGEQSETLGVNIVGSHIDSPRLDTKPINDGFRMPGEFEEQDGVYMLWPQRTDNWRNGAKPAQEEFVNVASTIGKYEKITINYFIIIFFC